MKLPLRFVMAWPHVVLWPRRSLTTLALAPRASGLMSVVAVATAWAALSLWLWSDGHAPSAPGLGWPPRQDHYLYQSVFLVPLMAIGWQVLSFVSHRVARALGGEGDAASVARPMAFAWSVPLLVAWVIPDVVVYAAFGFEALGPAVRFIAPVTLAWNIWLTTVTIEVVHGLPRRRAMLAAVVGLFAAGVVVAPMLR